MYRLYWSPGSAAMAPHAALIELGVPYELRLVDIAKGEAKHPDYLKLNPHARVPTLIHDDVVMYESAAILQYLCERHPAGGLAPAPGMPQRPYFLQWLTYLTNTMQEELQHWWHAENYVAPAACHAPMKETAERNLDRIWRFIDGHLAARGPYLLGETFSAADIFLTMLARWSRNCAKPAWTHPALGRLVERVKTRPAYARMLQEEGISQ
ncbi:MAG: glutathione S-transferase family protein [Pseudomonadota bacterium]